VEGDLGTVGITHFAQEQLGDLVYVELPAVGTKLSKGESFGCVESVKSSSDVYAPVSGEVVEVNQDLGDDPAKINAEPYGHGWMIKIKPENAKDAENLLSEKEYEDITNA
jgi:glycine cleavage system H protein